MRTIIYLSIIRISKSDWVEWNEKYGITHLLVHNGKKYEVEKQISKSLELLKKKFQNYYLYKIP